MAYGPEYFCDLPEVGPHALRVICIRGHTHHSAYMGGLQPLEATAAKVVEQFFGGESEFCLLAGHVKLHQDSGGHAGTPGLAVDYFEQMLCVDALYKRYPPHELTHFVGLQMADEMPFYIGRKLLLFLQQFLHSAFAKPTLPGGICLFDGLGRMKLRHCHQFHSAGYLPPEFLYG